MPERPRLRAAAAPAQRPLAGSVCSGGMGECDGAIASLAMSLLEGLRISGRSKVRVRVLAGWRIRILVAMARTAQAEERNE